MDQPPDHDKPTSGRRNPFEIGGLLDDDGLSRRKLLQLGGIGAGALALPGFLAACGSSGSSTGGSTAAASAESPELKKLLDGITSSQVIIASYGGDTEAARKKVFWEPFEARTGVQVVEADAGSLAVPMMQGEVPTKWDAVHGSVSEAYAALTGGKKKIGTTPKLAQEDLIEPKKMRPYIWQSFFIAYVPAMIKGTYSGAQPETWADFFDTKKFPGKRAWPAEYFTGGINEAALFADGVTPEEMYPLDLERAAAKIKSIFSDLVIYTEYAQSQSFLTSKTAAMSFAPNGLWKELEDKGVEVDVIWSANPILDANGMNILPEAPNPDAVEALAAFCNNPKLQAEFARITNYGPPTSEAFKELSKAEAEALPNAPGRSNAFHDDPIYLAGAQGEIFEVNEKTFS